MKFFCNSILVIFCLSPVATSFKTKSSPKILSISYLMFTLNFFPFVCVFPTYQLFSWNIFLFNAFHIPNFLTYPLTSNICIMLCCFHTFHSRHSTQNASQLNSICCLSIKIILLISLFFSLSSSFFNLLHSYNLILFSKIKSIQWLA